MRNQGYVVLEKLVCLEMLMFLYFEILYIYIFFIFELLENTCHTTRAVGQTQKEKENFSIFFGLVEESVTRREWPDRHNKNVKEPFFLFFFIF